MRILIKINLIVWIDILLKLKNIKIIRQNLMKKIEWMKYKLLKIISLKIKLNVLNIIQI